ncbi:unnamed protein product [Hermetia illucens]|uniref:Calcium-activated chloride channel N-terminal domain-containing protein n=2 Tax=Hermetia illucens TaxID=343691 RepID=A0A7R8V756_HERIL|nr:unnamed protein product [Hermetia illucens]
MKSMNTISFCGISKIVTGILLANIFIDIRSFVEASAYEEITIEIDENVPPNNCSEVLKMLEITLSATSRHLLTALDRTVYFSNFSIILPHTWPDYCLPANTSIDRSRGNPSDISITQDHLLFGDQIWTQQSGKCGERGDQIFASFNSFYRPSASKELLKEWIKYRYGVFDEIGYESDSIYPRCYTADKQYVTACSNEKITDNGFCDQTNQSINLERLVNPNADSSILFLPQPDNIKKVCDESNHDRLAPTKHNLLCGRRSVREIIMKSSDFITKPNNESLLNVKSFLISPLINYRRRLLTRYIIVIDETQNILMRESWSFLRSAIRKWLVYDLQSNTEVGIVLANENSVDKVLGLMGLDVSKNRDLIASFIPYIPSDSSQSACILCAIKEALKLFSHRRRTNGFASEVLLIIAPGIDDRLSYKSVVNWAIGNRTRFVTINFPTITRHRPMDELAILTGGEAFTVLEQKYNSEKSFLNTYFDLTTILFHVSCKYFEGPRSKLPVEVHRKELIDKMNDFNSSKRSSRVISGNFYLDEGMSTPSGFFIYTHNVEVPLIQNVKLTSPGGITYGTRSDQRIPVKQITIIASVNQTGPWSYRIERFNGNPQPHYVQVLATPRSTTNSIVQTRAWIRKSEFGGPFVLYCEVKRGGYPVHSAYVEVRITRPTLQCNYTNNCEEKLKLLDTGSGDPDITKGDGVYSRYFSTAISGPGMYRFDILVDDNGNTAYALPLNSEIIPTGSHKMVCCGSVITDIKTKQIPPFQRHLPSITITVNRNESETELKSIVGRIGDLTGSYIGDGKVRLTWTAPDMGGHSVVKYEVRYALNFFDIVNNFDTVASIWPHASPYPYAIGDITNFILDINLEPALYGSTIFIAIRPFTTLFTDVVPGLESNPIHVVIPNRISPTTPDTEITETSINQEKNAAESESDPTTGKSPVTRTNIKEYSIAIAVGIFLISIIIVLYLVYCITKRRRKQAKRDGLCSADIAHTTKIESLPRNEAVKICPNKGNLTDSLCQDDNIFQQQEHCQQHFNQNSNVHPVIEPPDHHVIGLPLCPDGSEYQKKDYVDRFTPTLYSACGTVSVISANDNNTFTRQGRVLSPYDSWTASQLLHEHEYRVSPIGDLLESPDHLTPNYDAPPIPPLPLNTDSYQIYGESVTQPNRQHRHQPPTYSTIRRNEGPPLQSSTHPTKLFHNKNSCPSISSTQQDVAHSFNEKKRRNVTMV